MKIAIGSDHRGVQLKSKIINYLKNIGIEYIDCGTDSEEKTDYPLIAQKVAMEVAKSENVNGILICGTGIGMSIAANKVKGIRCAVCYNLETAKYSKLHNNANIIALGAGQLTEENAIQMVTIWIQTEFEGGRHTNRLKQIEDIEKRNME